MLRTLLSDGVKRIQNVISGEELMAEMGRTIEGLRDGSISSDEAKQLNQAASALLREQRHLQQDAKLRGGALNSKFYENKQSKRTLRD